jgi:GT2 family glycosyltransferase
VIYDLSICIVDWNTGDQLKECLLSINKHTEDLNIEIIVIDNASTYSFLDKMKNRFKILYL